MKKITPQQKWNAANPEKMREASARYLAKKLKCGVIINDWVKNEIDLVKPKSQTYGAFVRQILEEWADERRF